MIATIDKPDILSTIRAENIETKHRGRYHWICCPFRSERTPSFKIDTERQSFYCFSCGAKGDSISFIQQYKGLSFREALAYLGIDTSVKPTYETLRRIRQAKEKAEIIKRFRKWGVDYHDDLCALYRCLQNAKDKCRTIADAEALAEFFHQEPIWIHRMDILESRDDAAKYTLYCEVNGNGN